MAMRKVTIVMAAFFSLQVLAAQVWATQRVALVIGNAAYEHAPRLANPLNDANDIGAALSRLGFKVTRFEDADYDRMRRGLKAFTRTAAGAEIAVVFYAGHGIEVDKRNFLIPVDARLVSDREVEFETVSLDLVSRAVEGASGLGLVILDACRDNPFAAAMKRSGAKRSIGRGLARVEPSGETLVAYAAKGGSVAADGAGRNSPYSTALLAHVQEPGLEVGLMFRKVRDAVLNATGGHQEPFVYGSLSSKGFYFSTAPVAAPVVSAPGGAAKGVVKSDEQLFWESVKESGDQADVEAYLEQFPQGTFAALARNRLKRLLEPEEETRGGDVEATEKALGLERTERKRIQIALRASGFDPGGRDGLFGPRTRAAIGKWQASRGKTETGYLDTEGAKTLLDVAPDLSGGVWAVVPGSDCKVWNPNPLAGHEVSWTGACERGKVTGQGRAVWKTARGVESYEGAYRKGRRHGRGVRELPDGTRYEGEWRNGRPPDRGVIVWPKGERYTGEWKAGKEHGRGTMIWPDGDRYEGEWKAGKKHGRGTYTWPDGGRYVGEWRDGSRNGRGVKTNPDGSRYEGGWKDSQLHGRGAFTWPDGGRYDGGWKDSKRHGRGTYTGSSGSRYEGEWRDGKIHGPGVLFDKHGKQRGAGNATNGCFGRRGGLWWTSGKTAEACGFK